MTTDPHELKARIDLTAALRSASRLGLGEGICNHFSLALPHQEQQFLINPQGLHWSEIKPADLVIVNEKGDKIAGRHEVEPTAFFIHSAIHREHPQARCVMHTHMPFATALTTITPMGLAWCSQNALKFYNRVAYDKHYNGLALDESEGSRLSQCMGKTDTQGLADILFLANHGVIVVGASVSATFDDLYYLERACQLQVLAMSTGKALNIIDDSIVLKTGLQMQEQSQQAQLHLEALKRLLDRDEPGWSRFD